MCIGLAQYKLDYGKSFREIDLDRLHQFQNLQAELQNHLNPSFRINLWKKALIYSLEGSDFNVRQAEFAWMSPKKSGGNWPVFNVRVEGGWNNKMNNPDYSGPYQIFSNPYVKEIIKTQRCIIPCDFFVEQAHDKKIKKKFIIKRPSENTINLAGVYHTTGSGLEEKLHFCILTTAYTEITSKVGHQRSPVIIPDEYIMDYLDPKTKEATLEALFAPNNDIQLNAYEVGLEIAKQKSEMKDNDPELIKALGPIIS